MRKLGYIFIATTALLLLASATRTHAQSAAQLDVVIRMASGDAVVGVVVKLYTVDEARGELKDLHESALTGADGIAHFALRPTLVAPRLLTGKSGIPLVSEEAQGYREPGLKFLTEGEQPIRIVILDSGVPVPDTTAAPAPPATPLVRSPKVGRPESRTWDEELAVRGQPTLIPALAIASATAWAAETGLEDGATVRQPPVNSTMTAIGHTNITPTTTILPAATPTLSSVQPIAASRSVGGVGMWSCLTLLILGFVLSLIYSRRIERQVATKGVNR